MYYTQYLHLINAFRISRFHSYTSKPHTPLMSNIIKGGNPSKFETCFPSCSNKRQKITMYPHTTWADSTARTCITLSIGRVGLICCETWLASVASMSYHLVLVS